MSDVRKTHLPTPSPSVASVPATLQAAEAANLLKAFKKPLPAVAAPGNNDKTQTYSSPTLSANKSPERLSIRGQGASVGSRVSGMMAPSRKRKEVDLDDYEQSIYSPSESSPFTERNTPSMFPNPPSKKSKITSALPRAKDSPQPAGLSVAPMGKKKNGTGFRTSTSSIPMTPSRMSSTKPKLSEPRKPAQKYHTRKSQASVTSPGKRNAAVKAQEMIQKISEADEEFHTNDQIFRATAKEARMGAAVTADLGKRLRSMSITPVPVGTRSNIPMNSTLSEVHTASPNAAVITKTNRSNRTYEGFLAKRATKGRPASRSRNIGQVIGHDSDEDFEEDLDISEFTYVNGIIIQAGQEERLTEVQTEATSVKEGQR
ncbi:hypothetical protein N0V95_002878 [Ascochyta clinopodiicola]|nr:hypothetical protein N0V95_002878 [Ascochyta clinopodiicola]